TLTPISISLRLSLHSGIKYRFRLLIVSAKGTAFAIARFLFRSAGDSFRKLVLNVPSINPSESIYAPAIRVMEVRFTFMRLVRASMSSLLILMFLKDSNAIVSSYLYLLSRGAARTASLQDKKSATSEYIIPPKRRYNTCI